MKFILLLTLLSGCSTLGKSIGTVLSGAGNGLASGSKPVQCYTNYSGGYAYTNCY